MNPFPSTVQSIIEEVDSASELEEEEHTKEDTEEDKEASEKRTYENVYEYLTKGCYPQGAAEKRVATAKEDEELPSCIGCWILYYKGKEGEVRIYDSLSSLPLTPAVEQQLLQLYGSTMSSGDNGLLVSSVPMQQQRGSCDCGIFTIATAFHIAAGNNIEDVVFDQTKMRSHLVQCFEKKVLSPEETNFRTSSSQYTATVVGLTHWMR